MSPIKLLLTEPFKLQRRILRCLIHLTQAQLIKLDAIWWESSGVIRRDGDTLDSLPGVQHGALSLRASVPGLCLLQGMRSQGAGLQQRHRLWQGGGAIKYSPKQLKGTNFPPSLLASGCSPVPSWCNKPSVSQGHFGNWGNSVLVGGGGEGGK